LFKGYLDLRIGQGPAEYVGNRPFLNGWCPERLGPEGQRLSIGVQVDQDTVAEECGDCSILLVLRGDHNDSEFRDIRELLGHVCHAY
jgi:hypothetical protein